MYKRIPFMQMRFGDAHFLNCDFFFFCCCVLRREERKTDSRLLLFLPSSDQIWKEMLRKIQKNPSQT